MTNWFTLSLLGTTDQNDHSTKSMAYHNSEQVYEPRLEPVSSGYNMHSVSICKLTLCNSRGITWWVEGKGRERERWGNGP